MIQIVKGDPPAALIAKGNELTKDLCDKYDANPQDYISAKKTFEFTGDYHSDAVQRELKSCQHNKCCFSEAKFNGDYFQVEHFRPKGRVDKYPKDGTKRYPGYYWLAYEWSNLFLCKGRPNVSYKQNFFPLMPNSPVNNSHNDNNVEVPMLINPSEDNPREHIVFHLDEPKWLTERGRVTIELCGLRHPDFEESRRTKCQELLDIKDIIVLLESDLEEPVGEKLDLINRFKARLEQAKEPQSEFSSMATDLLSD